MNKMKFLPHKDYNENRLKTGLLQLSDNTHLIIDETAMQAGQLDANGETTNQSCKLIMRDVGAVLGYNGISIVFVSISNFSYSLLIRTECHRRL